MWRPYIRCHVEHRAHQCRLRHQPADLANLRGAPGRSALSNVGLMDIKLERQRSLKTLTAVAKSVPRPRHENVCLSRLLASRSARRSKHGVSGQSVRGGRWFRLEVSTCARLERNGVCPSMLPIQLGRIVPRRRPGSVVLLLPKIVHSLLHQLRRWSLLRQCHQLPFRHRQLRQPHLFSHAFCPRRQSLL